MALAEKGVPWFADLKDILNTSPETQAEKPDLYPEKAERSAAKGASALIVYDKSMAPDMVFHPLMQEQTLCHTRALHLKKCIRKILF